MRRPQPLGKSESKARSATLAVAFRPGARGFQITMKPLTKDQVRVKCGDRLLWSANDIARRFRTSARTVRRRAMAKGVEPAQSVRGIKLWTRESVWLLLPGPQGVRNGR